MTDRVLPRVSPTREERPASDAVPSTARFARPDAVARGGPDRAPVGSAARFVRPRGEALLGPVTRAGVLIGVSAAIYAGSLALVAGLESKSQADAVAGTQPGLDAVARAKAANDLIETALKDADTRLKAMASDYASTSTDMAAYQAQFQQLSSLVAKIQGSAAAMNANFKLPSVTIRGSVGGGGGGTVVTTTSASGKP